MWNIRNSIVPWIFSANQHHRSSYVQHAWERFSMPTTMPWCSSLLSLNWKALRTKQATLPSPWPCQSAYCIGIDCLNCIFRISSNTTTRTQHTYGPRIWCAIPRNQSARLLFNASLARPVCWVIWSLPSISISVLAIRPPRPNTCFWPKWRIPSFNCVKLGSE